MPIIFKFINRPEKEKRERVAKINGISFHEMMQNYLNANEPKLIKWVMQAINRQQEAITYEEIEQAILRQEINPAWLTQWQNDYAKLIIDHFVPAWENAMKAASQALTQRYPEFVFDPTWGEVRRAVMNRSTKLPVQLAQTQMDALTGLIKQSAVLGEYTVDELSRLIRPLIGMVPREAAAVQNFYLALRKEGLSEAEARKKMLAYASRIHRHRAMRIARTELAFAFNEGVKQGVRQAQAQGFLGKVQKRWLTADDERVCPICGPLDETVIGQDELFKGKWEVPPAHPHCRCTVIYEEIEPPAVIMRKW